MFRKVAAKLFEETKTKYIESFRNGLANASLRLDFEVNG